MRIVFLMLLAMFAVNGSAAYGQAQDACSGTYIACLDNCVSRIAKAGQEKCIESCQARNNQCYAGIHGAAPQSSRIVPLSPIEPEEALAAKTPTPAATPVP